MKRLLMLFSDTDRYLRHQIYELSIEIYNYEAKNNKKAAILNRVKM